MEARIRPAERGDVSAWARLRAELYGGPASGHAEELERHFAQGLPALEAGLVAEEDGRLVGFAELSIHPYAEGCTGARVAYVEGWYVAPGARGRGVGRALVRAAEDWARARGLSELASDTRAENVSGAAAHRAVGFEEVGRLICYRRRLDAP